MGDGKFMQEPTQIPFWKKALGYFTNDYRKRPELKGEKSGKRYWWQPNYSEDQQKQIGRFLRKIGGKLPWNPNVNLENFQDSLENIMKNAKQKNQRQFDDWLNQYQSSSEFNRSEDDAVYFLLVGISAYRYKDYKTSIQVLNQGLELARDTQLKALFYQNLGYVEHEQLRLDQAEFYFTQSMKLIPDNSGFYINLGWNHFLKQEFEKCLEYNKKARELDTTNWVPHFNIAISYLAMENYWDAYESYQRLNRDQLGENTYYYILEDLFTLKKMQSSNHAINFFIGYTYLNRKMFSRAGEYFQLYLDDPQPAAPQEFLNDARQYLSHIQSKNE